MMISRVTAQMLFRWEQQAEFENYPRLFGQDFDKYVGVTRRRPIEVRSRDVERWEANRT